MAAAQEAAGPVVDADPVKGQPALIPSLSSMQPFVSETARWNS